MSAVCAVSGCGNPVDLGNYPNGSCWRHQRQSVSHVAARRSAVPEAPAQSATQVMELTGHGIMGALRQEMGYPLLGDDETVGTERGDLFARRLVPVAEGGDGITLVDRDHPSLRFRDLPLTEDAAQTPDIDPVVVTEGMVGKEMTRMSRRGHVDDEESEALRDALDSEDWSRLPRELMARVVTRVALDSGFVEESYLSEQKVHDALWLGTDEVSSSIGMSTGKICPECFTVRSTNGSCDC